MAVSAVQDDKKNIHSFKKLHIFAGPSKTEDLFAEEYIAPFGLIYPSTLLFSDKLILPYGGGNANFL